MNINTQFHEALKGVESLKKANSALFSGMIKYDANNVAFEFFPESFCDAEKQKNNIPLRPINEEYIQERIKDFDNSLKNFHKNLLDLRDNLHLSDIQKDFLRTVMEKAIIQLEYFKKSIWLEAEKSGQFHLDETKRKQLLTEINDLQDIVYGREIITQENEKQMILESIYKLYQKNSEKITEEEKGILENFFKKFDFDGRERQKNTPKENIENHTNTKSLKELYIFDNNSTNSAETEENADGFTQNEKDFKEIILLVLETYGLRQKPDTDSSYQVNNSHDWQVIIDDNASMFSASFSARQIKVPRSKIATTSVFRLLQLLDHEIGVHAIRGHNTMQSLRIAGPNYLDAEEGLATHSEEMFENNIEDISGGVTLHHITTFIAENYNAEDTKKLLQIYYKLEGVKNPEKTAYDRMLRVKRFVSFDLPGANRKDVAYTRGNIDISHKLAFLSSEERKNFLKNFYYSKLALEDQNFVQEFSKIFGDKDHKYPMWIGKIIFKKLLGEKIFFDEFMKKDRRFVMDSISYSTKKDVVRVLQSLRNKISQYEKAQENTNTHM